MSQQRSLVEIDHRHTALQPAFCDYVPRVFRRADFRLWREWGQWTSDYRAFSVIDAGRVIANASVMRMHLLLDGREADGYQLGAVGCVPEHRGQGLARVALDAALSFCGDAPVFLFGNETVRDFYPRFGFQPAAQMRFGVEFAAVPSTQGAPRLDPADAGTRSALLARMRASRPVTERFGARAYPHIAAWYSANGFARPLRALTDSAWVYAGVEEGVLHIDEVIAPEAFDLRPHIARLIDEPVHAVHFGFTPEQWWLDAPVLGEDGEADLFVRGFALPDGPHRFPVMAGT